MRFVITLLLAGLACAGPALADTRAGAGRAQQFDALYRQLDTAQLRATTAEGAQAQLARLRALIPAGDAHRALRYRAMACFQPPRDVQASLQEARRGLAEARARGDIELQARFTYCEAAFTDMTGGTPAALRLYGHGLELSGRAESPLLVGAGLMARGNVRSYVGEHAAALADFMAAQRVLQASGLQAFVDSNLQNIGIAYRRMGEFEQARAYLERAREVALRQQDWDAVLVHWLQTGYLHEDLGEPDRALAAYGEALRIARQRLGPGDAGSAELGMASALIGKGRPEEALGALARAQADFAQIGDTSDAGMIAFLQGQARAAMGRNDAALVDFATAERAFSAEANDRYLALLYPARAAVFERTGRPAQALADYKRYLELRAKLDSARTDQRAQMLRQQFETRQREAENARLRREKALQARELAASQRARRWQAIAIGLGLLVLAGLALVIVQQMASLRRLRVLALTDALTGVANRRRIELVAGEAVRVARTRREPLCLLVFDVDHFKRINDTFGHLVGDEALARVAQVCQQALRHGDALGRIGGEEFLVVLPDTELEAARQVAERLRTNVEALRWTSMAQDLRVTISLGVAQLSADDSALQDLLRRADAALARAKDAGRNTLVAAG